MATWTLDFRDRIGAGLLKADASFRALTARWVLNGPGSLEVDLHVDADIGGAVMGESELWLRRDAAVVWAGPWLGSDVDARGRTLRINAEGLWSWFRVRVVTDDLVWTTPTSQHAIAWALLAHTQAQTFGSLGITDGVATGTPTLRKRFYCGHERPNIAESVEAFTELEDGFDFEIDPTTRQFNTFTPARKAASGITLDGTKVDHLTYTEDIRSAANFVTGIGSDDCGPILVERSDTALANTYGRRHVPLDADSDETGEISEAAGEYLRANKRPRFDAQVIFREGGTGAPAWASLVVGNTLVLGDDRGYATYSRTMRIVEKSVSLDSGLPNQPVIGLALTSAVD